MKLLEERLRLVLFIKSLVFFGFWKFDVTFFWP